MKRSFFCQSINERKTKSLIVNCANNKGIAQWKLWCVLLPLLQNANGGILWFFKNNNVLAVVAEQVKIHVKPLNFKKRNYNGIGLKYLRWKEGYNRFFTVNICQMAL